MEILTKMKRKLEIKEIIESAISNWYFENGIQEPNWKMQKDPKWWTDYLNELNNDNK